MSYQTLPIKTSVVMPNDDLIPVLQAALEGKTKEGDIVTLAESVVAISQGRAYLIKDIKPSRLAKFLSHFVQKSDVGIGLGMPETMHLAIKEIGAPRILLAAMVAGVLTKVFKIKGVFYRIAGKAAKQVDGPCSYTLPPFNTYATLGPKKPEQEAQRLAEKLGVKFAIVDANDLGVDVLGMSDNIELSGEEIAKILKENPFGQSDEQTPVVIIREG